RAAARHGDAVGARHLEVDSPGVDRVALEEVEPLTPAPGDEGLVAADALQVIGVLLRHGGHVVDHHYDRHGKPTLKGWARQNTALKGSAPTGPGFSLGLTTPLLVVR